MASKGKNNTKRDITYQVGWKKGRIKSIQSDDDRSSSIQRMPLHSPLNRFMRIFIWRPVPFIPAVAAIYLLWLLPIVILIPLIWLYVKLTH